MRANPHRIEWNGVMSNCYCYGTFHIDQVRARNITRLGRRNMEHNSNDVVVSTMMTTQTTETSNNRTTETVQTLTHLVMHTVHDVRL